MIDGRTGEAQPAGESPIRGLKGLCRRNDALGVAASALRP